MLRCPGDALEHWVLDQPTPRDSADRLKSQKTQGIQDCNASKSWIGLRTVQSIWSRLPTIGRASSAARDLQQGRNQPIAAGAIWFASPRCDLGSTLRALPFRNPSPSCRT